MFSNYYRQSCLFEEGGRLVEKKFRQMVAEHSRPIPPHVLIELAHDEDSSLDVKQKPAINNISGWLLFVTLSLAVIILIILLL